MQAQMELAEEEEEGEGIEEVVEELTGIEPEMATADDVESVEDYAVNDEFVSDVDESAEF